MKEHFIKCDCGDPHHQVILNWDDYVCGVYAEIHLTKFSFWERLKVAIKYIFGKQSIYGALDEIFIPVSIWREFQEMVDFMKECDEKRTINRYGIYNGRNYKENSRKYK